MSLKPLIDLYRRVQVLGGTWGVFREEYLRSSRDDGKPERVLDAACGEGQLRGDFKRFSVPVDYYGVDLAVGDANWKFSVTALADMHALPFKDGSFDKVISIQTLEHVDRPHEVVSELGRVLRPGGEMFLAIPMAWHVHQEPHDRFRFTAPGIQYLASKEALDIVSLKPMGGYFTVLRYLLTNYSFLATKPGRGWNLLARLLNRPIKLLDRVFLAPLFFLLDFLDSEKKMTIGYHVRMRKPGPRNTALPQDPYCCPCCVNPRSELRKSRDAWSCVTCGRIFEVRKDIPSLVPENSYAPRSAHIQSSQPTL